MAYNATIPAPTDQLNVSQGQIFNNFAAISTLVNVNHVDFNTADQGKHKFVTFPEQVSPPTAGATEVILYSAQSAFSSRTELIYQSAGDLINLELTAGILNSPGWSYLPSGLLLKWDTGLDATGGAQTFLYPTGSDIPVFNNVFALFLTITQAGGTDVDAAIYVSDSSNPVQFEISSWQRTQISMPLGCFFSYYAIGN